jgi:formate hydrogenlyase transcriptional activator
VKLNCAAIPTGLLESELFGHEKGAFTGAISQKIGRLELADQGTLFLDEVGDISIEIQPKLLRAIQEREFERLGSTHTRKVNVRLVAATNRDLEKMIADREFRSQFEATDFLCDGSGKCTCLEQVEGNGGTVEFDPPWNADTGPVS